MNENSKIYNTFLRTLCYIEILEIQLLRST